MDRQIYQLTEKTELELTDVIPIQSANGSAEARSTPMSAVATTVLGELSVRVTYAELVALVSAANLVVGRKYIIRDYQTIHVIPNTSDINVGTVEPLVVTAIQSNKIDCVVQSIVYPNDIIYYSLTNSNAVVNGSTKGYIYRRIDTVQNNDLPFDFREVKFRRWQLNVTTQDATGAVSNYTTGDVVKKTSTNEIYIKLNNTTAVAFTNTSSWMLLPFSNASYSSPTATNWVLINDFIGVSIPCSASYTDYKAWSSDSFYSTAYNNKISSNTNVEILTNNNTVFFGGFVVNNTMNCLFKNNSILGYFSNNNINASFNDNAIATYFTGNSVNVFFNNNVIGQSFDNNDIAGYFYSNVVNYDFKYNKIGSGFNNNTVAITCVQNVIEAGATANVIGSTFSKNNISANFAYNTIGINVLENIIASQFQSNVIGNGFQQNNIGSNVTNNTIGTGCKYNFIGNFCLNNTIGNVFQYNTVGSQLQTNTIGNGFENNSIGNGFFSNTVGDGFRRNVVNDYFNNKNFTSSTHVYAAYNCVLYIGTPSSATAGNLTYINDSSQLVVALATA